MERYEALRATAGRPGAEVGLNAPVFACHKSADGKEIACAGWLARVGMDHLGIRLAVVTGDIDPAQLEPGDGWPELYETYDELVEAQNG